MDGFDLSDLPEFVVPPTDVHDAAAWDQYWERQLANPLAAGMALMSADMFSDDAELVRVMRANGMTSVLCVGHGISREPAALSKAGFSVMGLELSERVAGVCRRIGVNWQDDDMVLRIIGPDEQRPGGTLTFVTGDLTDASVCPGPFDVIIERKTVQLFGDELGRALEALAARLATPGILFSQCHNGAWRPSDPRMHLSEAWFEAEGWPLWRGRQDESGLQGRVAWLLTSSG